MDDLRGEGEDRDGDVVFLPYDDNATLATIGTRLNEVMITKIIRKVSMIHHLSFKEDEDAWVVDANHGLILLPKFYTIGPSSISNQIALHHCFCC